MELDPYYLYLDNTERYGSFCFPPPPQKKDLKFHLLWNTYTFQMYLCLSKELRYASEYASDMPQSDI